MRATDVISSADGLRELDDSLCSHEWLLEMLASDYARADRFHEGDSGRLEAIEHQSHGHRALADGRRHPLDRSATDIADAEDSWAARLEQQWQMINALELSHCNVSASEHEAVFVHG